MKGEVAEIEKRYKFNPKNCYIYQKSFILLGSSALVLLFAVVEIKSQTELTRLSSIEISCIMALIRYVLIYVCIMFMPA